MGAGQREGKLEKVQKREGLVCVCAECKKVIKVVGNVAADSAPLISHGICPECAERLYGSLFRGPDENGATVRPPGAGGAG